MTQRINKNKNKKKSRAISSVLNIPVSELLYDNEEMACISTNEAVDELRGNRLIKAVNVELEEWLCSGDTDYLHKAMAVIRAELTMNCSMRLINS